MAETPAATTVPADQTRIRGPRTGMLEVAALLGFGALFLVNALAAVVQPEDFERLVADSAFAPLADAEWLPVLIGINDLVVGLALIAAIWLSRFRLIVLAWAGVWLLAVSAIRLTSMF
jgi:hypothetical protein